MLLFQDIPSTRVNFWSIDLGNIIAIGTMMTAFLAYIIDRKSEREQRNAGQARLREKEDENLRRQEKMHTENRERLEALKIFRENQERLNDKRDAQISMLTTLTATVSEALKGFNRRLELAENEAREQRVRCDNRHGD